MWVEIVEVEHGYSISATQILKFEKINKEEKNMDTEYIIMYVSYLKTFPIYSNLNFFMLPSFDILSKFYIPGLWTSFS